MKNNSLRNEFLFISFLFIVAIFLIIVFAINTPINRNDYGEFVIDRQECINGNRLVIRTCNPNPTTNKGCIDNNGQTFIPKVYTESCENSNIRSEWRTIQSDCINGTRNVTVECIQRDLDGSNQCINLESPTEFGVKVPVMYQVGEFFTYSERCN